MTRARELVGVLGGTFDPVHEGHLAMATRAHRSLRLSRMLMVLTGTPPHKQAAALTPYAHRAAMLELAIHGCEGLELSKLESDEEVSYTIVGEEEADAKLGRISVTSPVARALMNKEVGDEVNVKVPKGMREFGILAIRFDEL